MKRIMMIFGVGLACLGAGLQSGYAWHISGAHADPSRPEICDGSFSVSGSGNLVCDEMDPEATGGKTVPHVPGEESPVTVTFSISATTPDGQVVSSPPITAQINYKISCSAGGCDKPGTLKAAVPADASSSVNSKIGLGQSGDGESAGYLRLVADSPSPLLSSPRGLQLFGKADDVEEITDNVEQGMLRQVMAPQCFVDVIVANDFQYDTKFYLPDDVESELDTNGYYVVKSGRQPFSVCTFKNPSGSTNDVSTFDIIQTVGGETNTNEFHYEQDTNGVATWGLATGGGLRTEYLSTVSNETGPIKTRTIKTSAGVVVSKERKTYHALSNGEMALLEKVADPDGAALTTSIGYYENEAQTGKYGNICMTVNPGGSWTRNDYNEGGLISEERSGWLNAVTNAGSNEARSVAYEYAPFYYTLSTNEVVTNGVTNLVVMTNWVDNGTTDLTKPRVETESILGQVVGKTYRAIYLDTTGDKVEIEEKCVNPDAESGDESNLRTVRVYTPKNESSLAVSERIKRIDYPDGRRETYTYELGHFAANSNNPGSSVFIEDAVTGQYVRVSCVYGTIDNPNGIANKTTKDVTIENHVRQPVMQETYAYTGGYSYTRIAWVVNNLDDLGRPTSVYKSNGTHSETTWGCCGKEWEKDENGVEYSYTYDALKRATQKVKSGISAGEYPAQADQYTTYTYDAEGRQLTATVSAGGLSQSSSNTYDLAGRITKSTDASGLVTETTYADGGRTVTQTFPGGFTRITERYKDGQVKSITGTAQISQYYDYGVNEDGTKWTKVFTATADSPVWVKTTTDLLGQTAKIEKPGYSGTETTEYFFNNKGQLVRQTVDSGQSTVVALYAYDEIGNQISSGLDVNDNGELDLVGTDRITESEKCYELISDIWYLTTVSRLYATDSSADAITNSVTRQRLTGFAANTIAETISIDSLENQTVSTTVLDRTNKKVTQTVNVLDSSGDNISIAVNGLLVSSQRPTLSAPTLFAYDALGRRTTVTDPRLGTAITHYDSHGRVDYGEDAAGNRTTFTYDSANGRQTAKTDPLTNTTYFTYTAYGQLEKTWGSGAYPVWYEYDGYNRMVKKHTYRSGSGFSGSTWPSGVGNGDVTERIYHEDSGLLTLEKDAAGKSVSYTYASGEKLASRTWSRVNGTNSLVTSYSYSDAGDIEDISYSDGTPDVSFTYDRLGRQKTAESSIRSHVFAYSGMQLTSEMISGDGVTNVIDRSYDSFGRSTGCTLGDNYSVTYGYDSLGRFASASSASLAVNYSYLPNSELIQALSYNSGLAVTRSYEQNRNLLTQVKNEINSSLISQFDYANDAGSRRTSVKHSGSAFETGAAFNKYEYNSRSEVLSGNKYWGANLNDTSDPVLGQGVAYAYDNIGNRNTTVKNGNTETYTANSLNQYSQRTLPGAMDILGSAQTNATVTLNGASVTRHGKYWYKNLGVTNTGNAVYQSVNVMGIYNPPGTNDPDVISTASGHVFTAKTPELFTYDDDGNLLSDGRFNYSWECENRLIGAETLNNLLASVPRVKVESAYDYQSRRVSKKVYSWFTDHWSLTSDLSFVYDGWNLISEIVDTPTLTYTNTYIWGLDFSGSLQGAGGIGGLVSVTRSTSTGTATYYPCYDGNGNITDYVDTNGVIIAHREYDPFGNTIVATGPMVNDFNFWFSTKYLDRETGLYYYGYRYYSPSLGRWLSRDPIQNTVKTPYRDAGSLYLFVLNSPIAAVDILGLISEGETCKKEGDPGWGDPSYTYETSGVYDGECWCQCYLTKTTTEKTFICRLVYKHNGVDYHALEWMHAPPDRVTPGWPIPTSRFGCESQAECTNTCAFLAGP